MQLDFNGGRFVSGQGELNYQAVLDDFPRAKTIRIITFNISRNQRQDALLDALKNASAADVQFITNIPSRMKEYFNTDAGRNMRSSAQRNIQTYIAKLNPDNYEGSFIPYFNLSILVNPEIIPILSGFHSSIIRTRKRPALVLISDTKLLCKNDYKTISAA